MAVNVGGSGAKAAAPAPTIPFTRAAMWKTQQAGSFNFTAANSTANAAQAPVLIPAAGYLRGIEIIVTATG